MTKQQTVIPAKAGIHEGGLRFWIPDQVGNDMLWRQVFRPDAFLIVLEAVGCGDPTAQKFNLE